jgi:tetratricopeptide (TPR) repeat protein
MVIDEKALFVAALARPDAEEREAYLQAACAGRPELLGRLRELLAAHEESQGPLDRRPAAPGVTMDTAHTAGPGSVIGRYKLIEQIGEGGMGTVWMAQQTEPVKRLVAVKLIKAGMDSQQVVARFEAERQALALMDHANIARVLDAGTAGAGRPYFVMDLVKGVPITRYCDERHLTPRQRLALFLPVCQAVQHAHQKGIIHRDLKPSNVLVALYDGKPVPKVIDFGVAKAAGQTLTDKTLVTGFGSLVGTLEYMSPEQAEVNQLDIDTRSDVYSLGVLLYELLAGAPPFTRKDSERGGMLEMLRVIREQEPTKPSAKLSTAEGLPTLAAKRGTDPAKLTRLVRGELDWIVMKALEKDRSRRYETANGFAMDVQRYLADETVQACPPSAGYRLGKFVRRNRRTVVAASLVAITLLAGVVGTTVGLMQAKQRAEGQQRAKESAEKRLAQIEKGIDILSSVFENLRPQAEVNEGQSLQSLLGERLDQAAAELEGEAVGEPLVVARLQSRLGWTYLGLGRADKAEVLFAKALATRQAALGADHPLTLIALYNQAAAYHHLRKENKAIEQFERVRDAQVKILGPSHVDTLNTLQGLGEAYAGAGKVTEAITLLEQVRDEQVKQFGEDDPSTLTTLKMLAATYKGDRITESIALYEKVLEIQRRKNGDGHPRVIITMINLGAAYQAGFKMKQAIALYEKARAAAVIRLGPEHPHTLTAMHCLANMYRAYRRLPEAIALFELVRDGRLKVLGADHMDTLGTLHNLGRAYQAAGQPDKALPLFQQSAAGMERLKFTYQESWALVWNLCNCHEELAQYEQAEVWRRKWLNFVKANHGPESQEYCRDLEGLGVNLLKQQKYAEAEPVFRERLTILQKKPSQARLTWQPQSQLGAALLGQQKYAEAEPLLIQAYQGMKKMERDVGHELPGPSTKGRVTESLEWLVQLYDAWNKPEEAAKWRKELEARTKAADKVVPPTMK